MKTEMKNHAVVFLLLLAVALFFSGCDALEYTPPTPEVKTILMKEAVVEQRMGFDVFANETLRQKTVTVYYLVAEDGTVTEVGLSDYATAKIGGQFASASWHVKN
jgi:hypothetical protein